MHGPRARVTIRPVRFAVGVAFEAVLVATVLYFAVSAVASPSTGSGGGTGAESLFLIPIIAIYATLTGLPHTLPVAFVATGLLRLWSSRPRAGGAVLLAAMIAGPFVGQVLGPSAISALDPRFAYGRDVTLTWTIENRTPAPYELSVSSEDPDGSVGGWLAVIEGCFITTGIQGEPDGWFLTLVPYTDESWEERGPEIVSSDEAPGSAPSIWVSILENGELEVDPNRAPPTTEELTADVCAASPG